MKYIMASLTTASCLLLVAAGTAFAGKTLQVPTTGQPGVGTSTGPSSNPSHACGSAGTATPGGAVTASGSQSVFNGGGQASAVYAGNPGTASMTHSNSAAAVSQYDIACFQVP
jgi:hypothetical protein